eukprot:GHUV01029277.1.p1 GENE.GHUV01029277.1~~GHUV01029277.1.p1  ORF type:complete len:143 (-),score=20.09 GHUV01029277.1:573-1001(-)
MQDWPYCQCLSYHSAQLGSVKQTLNSLLERSVSWFVGCTEPAYALHSQMRGAGTNFTDSMTIGPSTSSSSNNKQLQVHHAPGTSCVVQAVWHTLSSGGCCPGCLRSWRSCSSSQVGHIGTLHQLHESAPELCSMLWFVACSC